MLTLSVIILVAKKNTLEMIETKTKDTEIKESSVIEEILQNVMFETGAINEDFEDRNPLQNNITMGNSDCIEDLTCLKTEDLKLQNQNLENDSTEERKQFENDKKIMQGDFNRMLSEMRYELDEMKEYNQVMSAELGESNTPIDIVIPLYVVDEILKHFDLPSNLKKIIFVSIRQTWSIFRDDKI